MSPPSATSHTSSAPTTRQAPTTRLTAKDRRHLRRRAHALARLRQLEWGKGAPGSMTDRPGMSHRNVAVIEGELGRTWEGIRGERSASKGVLGHEADS